MKTRARDQEMRMKVKAVSSFNPPDVFEATAALVQPSGKVSIQYDESKKTDY